MKRLRYEWDIESVDEHGDIQDHNFRDKLSEFEGKLRSEIPLAKHEKLVLVRDELDIDGGTIGRSWAYVENGQIEESFKDSGGGDVTPVPLRFIKELRQSIFCN